MNEARRLEILKRIASSGPKALAFPDDGHTYWNGQRADACIVRVIVGKAPKPTWWCADLEGTEREAVEVTYAGQVFYLDNEDGSGWRKVTIYRGSPQAYHAGLPVAAVLD